MKHLWPILLVTAMAAACAKNKPAGESAATKPASGTNTVVVTPHLQPVGQIASVNSRDRFVVLSYPTPNLPRTDQRLNVYRQGRKVGELRVTGPARDTITAADVLAGDVAVGDEVRIN